MVEDISTILKKGFDTYTNNLNLCIPFVFNMIVTGLISLLVLEQGFSNIFGPSMTYLETASTPEAFISIILPIIRTHFVEIIGLVIIYFLLSLFFQSFFLAGAIGMVKQAIETGRTELSTMMDSGKKNFLNLFFAQILVALLFLSGIVFLVPAAIKTDIHFFSNFTTISLVMAGIFLWFIYIIVLGLMLSVFSYALVIENQEPVEGIITGFRFFNSHKSNVLRMWLVTGIIILVITFIATAINTIPLISEISPLIDMFFSAFVFAPLTTLFWVRLYMSGTGKKLYFNELLAHPNDLEN